MESMNSLRLPLYAKMALVAIILYLLLNFISVAQGILLPFGFAFLFAVLLLPVENFFLRVGVPRVGAIILTLVVFVLVVYLVIRFISGQIYMFADHMPQLQESMGGLWGKIQDWLRINLNISMAKQQQLIEDAKGKTVNTLAPGTFNLITSSFAIMMLIPVYIFLMLFYRSRFLAFFIEVFDQRYSRQVTETVLEVKRVIQHFIIGVVMETSIVAVLNVVALLIIGAPFAILLGVVGALMNTIPYIGGIIQLILSGMVVFANTGSLPKAGITVAVLLGIQMIDNYFLIPRIVSSRVKLNALFSILGVLSAGAICGVGGMFLAVPFLATAKVIFDRVDDLKPWGKLIGGEEVKLPKKVLVRAARK
jgi:predicted PurR-regulated permease PerM